MSYHTAIKIPDRVEDITDAQVEALVNAVEMNRGPGRWSGPPAFGTFSESDGVVMAVFQIVGIWVAIEGELTFADIVDVIIEANNEKAVVPRELVKRVHAKLFPGGTVPPVPEAPPMQRFPND